MILLILVALWIVVLAPAFVKKLIERRSTESIESFHQSLHLLERAGPKLMPPAYRLETAQSATGIAVGQSGFPAVSSRPTRPNLVLLQPVGEGGAGSDEVVDDASGEHYRRVLSPPVEEVPGRGLAAARAEELRRTQAQRRRRDLLVGLGGTVVVSGLVGIAVPALWVLTVMGAVAIAGYVGLAAYAQLLEVDRRGRPHRMGGYSYSSSQGSLVPGEAWPDQVPAPRSTAEARWMATVGYPGAWDDEGEDAGYGEAAEAAAR